MLRSRIIPCLLMSKKGLVKTEKFTNPKYIGDPINAVRIFNEKKVDELIIFDIDSSRNKIKPDFKKLKIIANESRMPLTYGGGISTVEDARKIISLGYEKISLSNNAINDMNIIKKISNIIGSQSVVVTLDYRRNFITKKYSVYTLNGTKRINHNILNLAQKFESLGAGEILFNSIDRDGMLNGYDIDFAELIRSKINTQISFVGGAKDISDMEKLIDSVGIVGAAAGSMFLFKGKFKAVLLSYRKPSRCE